MKVLSKFMFVALMLVAVGVITSATALSAKAQEPGEYNLYKRLVHGNGTPERWQYVGSYQQRLGDAKTDGEDIHGHFPDEDADGYYQVAVMYNGRVVWQMLGRP